ncbi:NTF2 fold immunity protein [uncultured Bacteroides sp.]|uniref:NTF2 fold immunity protein n=1 Tax=uncultured Bacteroides sp. TaxID=162156 RepID=UPI00374A1AB3
MPIISYGKQEIVQERPYKIGLIKNYWVITGSFKDYNKTGGTFEIVIDANDGAVKGITHEK